MSNKLAYLELQKESGIKDGDRVKILRLPEAWELELIDVAGLTNEWERLGIGGEYYVSSVGVRGVCGYIDNTNLLAFLPFWCLEVLAQNEWEIVNYGETLTVCFDGDRMPSGVSFAPPSDDDNDYHFETIKALYKIVKEIEARQ